MPKIWLMTDSRIADDVLLAAIARLPRGVGIVFRHYDLPPAQRRQFFDRVRVAARRRQAMLLLAGSLRQAVAWRADGWHGRNAGRPAHGMLHSAPAHSLREIRAAEAAGASLLFVSPIFPTRSHPAAPTLGAMRLAGLVRQARRPVIALGGMTARRAASLHNSGIYGWAAIDALTQTIIRTGAIRT